MHPTEFPTPRTPRYWRRKDTGLKTGGQGEAVLSNGQAKAPFCGLCTRGRWPRTWVRFPPALPLRGRAGPPAPGFRQEGAHLVTPCAPCCRRRSPRGQALQKRLRFPRQPSREGPDNLAFKIGGTRIRPAERGARRAAHAQDGLPVPQAARARAGRPGPAARRGAGARAAAPRAPPRAAGWNMSGRRVLSSQRVRLGKVPWPGGQRWREREVIFCRRASWELSTEHQNIKRLFRGWWRAIDLSTLNAVAPALSSKSCGSARLSSALGFVPVSSTLEGVETRADRSYPVISLSISVTFPFSSQFSTRSPEYPGPQLSMSPLKLGSTYLGGQQAESAESAPNLK